MAQTVPFEGVNLPDFVGSRHHFEYVDVCCVGFGVVFEENPEHFTFAHADVETVVENHFRVGDFCREQFHYASPDTAIDIDVASVKTFQNVDRDLHRVVEVVFVSNLAFPFELAFIDVLFNGVPFPEGVDDIFGEGIDGHGVGENFDVFDHIFGTGEGHDAHRFGSRTDFLCSGSVENKCQKEDCK